MEQTQNEPRLTRTNQPNPPSSGPEQEDLSPMDDDLTNPGYWGMRTDGDGENFTDIVFPNTSMGSAGLDLEDQGFSIRDASDPSTGITFDDDTGYVDDDTDDDYLDDDTEDIEPDLAHTSAETWSPVQPQISEEGLEGEDQLFGNSTLTGGETRRTASGSGRISGGQ